VSFVRTIFCSPRAQNTSWIVGASCSRGSLALIAIYTVLSSDINPSDPSLIDLTDDNDVPTDAQIEEYGYGSDSDLDDCNDLIPEAPKDSTATLSDSPSKRSYETKAKDDDEYGLAIFAQFPTDIHSQVVR
jgi:hypothetical protein